MGLHRDRLAMLLTVLHHHAGVACMDLDVFVNAVGGVRITGPAADLAVKLAGEVRHAPEEASRYQLPPEGDGQAHARLRQLNLRLT